jgi:hypothetical protein
MSTELEKLRTEKVHLVEDLRDTTNERDALKAEMEAVRQELASTRQELTSTRQDILTANARISQLEAPREVPYYPAQVEKLAPPSGPSIPTYFTPAPQGAEAGALGSFFDLSLSPGYAGYRNGPPEFNDWGGPREIVVQPVPPSFTSIV